MKLFNKLVQKWREAIKEKEEPITPIRKLLNRDIVQSNGNYCKSDLTELNYPVTDPIERLKKLNLKGLENVDNPVSRYQYEYVVNILLDHIEDLSSKWGLTFVNGVRAYTEIKINGELLSDVELFNFNRGSKKLIKSGSIKVNNQDTVLFFDNAEIVIRQKMQDFVVVTTLEKCFTKLGNGEVEFYFEKASICME